MSNNTTVMAASDQSAGSSPLPLAIKYGLGCSLATICVFGIVGNLFSLVILNSKKRFTACMFVYVRWMAFSDLAAMMFLLPEAIYKSVAGQGYDNVVQAWYFAHFSTPLSNGLFGCSSLLVVAMTIERYISVCHPLREKWLSSVGRARLVVAAIYLTCFLVYIPTVFEWTVVSPAPNTTTPPVYMAQPNYPLITHVAYRLAYSWIRAIIIRFVPIVLIMVLNAITLVNYRGIVARRKQLLTKDKKKRADEGSVIVILVVTAVSYVVCLSPNPFIHCLLHVGDFQQHFGLFIAAVVGTNLEVLNAAGNFYLYCMACRDFRDALKDTLISRLVMSFGRLENTDSSVGWLSTAPAAGKKSSSALLGNGATSERKPSNMSGNMELQENGQGAPLMEHHE